MPKPHAPEGWVVHLSESKLRYYFYNPEDGSAVWPANLDKHLELKSAGQKVASGKDHAAYLATLDDKLATTIQGKRDYFFKGLDAATRDAIMLDEEASYSVTEQSLAERSSSKLSSPHAPTTV